MPFGAPWWLLATAAGSLPLIIHLLNRQRFKRVTWAAMTFLLAALQKNRRRMRLENLIVLLLRIAVLVLLALAFAQPFLGPNHPLKLGGGVRTCRVFVLDDSYSMGQELAGTTPFDRARDVIRTVLAKAGGGDWGMVVTAATLPEVLPEPGTNLTELTSSLEKLPVSNRRADLPVTLTKVLDVLARGNYPRAEVYVLTDFQRASWITDGVLRDKALPAALEKLPETTAVFLVDTGGQAERPNLAVTALDLSMGQRDVPQRLVAADSPVDVWGTIVNFGREPVQNVAVRLLSDGRVEGRKTVSVPAGKSAEMDFPGIVFNQTGFHVLQLECDHDSLKVDDQRVLSVDVKEKVSALCVNGQPSADLVSNETYFLERSLSPQQFEFAQGLSVFTTQTVSDVDFLQANLADYDLVVLANVFQVPAEKARVLERYVEGGGALLVFLGDRVESGAYDSELYADGKGLLPVRLLQPHVIPQSENRFVHFDVRNAQHPVLRVLARENVDLGLARTWGYFDAAVDETNAAVQVLCRYDDEGGTPAMVEKRYGTGRVMVVNTSADAGWSTFAAGPFFPLFVQETARYLVRGSLEEGNLTVGEPLRQVLFPGEFGQKVLVTDPQGDVIPVLPEPTGQTYLFRYTGTPWAGVYSVDFGGTRGRALYAATLDTSESDLERTDQSELDGATKFKRFVYVMDPTNLARTVELAATSRPIWREILFVVLGIMLLESILAQRFGSRTGVRRKTS